MTFHEYSIIFWGPAHLASELALRAAQLPQPALQPLVEGSRGTLRVADLGLRSFQLPNR